jgi:hypothetical protein
MPSPDASQLPSHQRSILRQILAYVIVYPDAKDTLQGIRKWWRLGGRAEPGEDEIQGVLNFLVARGWVTEREVTPAPRIYGLNKERLAEITAFLQELECRTADGKEE